MKFLSQNFFHSVALLTLAASVMGCPVPKSSSSNSNAAAPSFYAHCATIGQTSVLDVQGNTGTAATASAAEIDGSGTLSENTNLCQGQWNPVNIQPNLNGTSETLSIYTPGTTQVILDLDFSPYHQNPDAASWQTTGIIESGFLYNTSLNCTLYVAHETTGACSASVTSLVSCPNLGWQICNDSSQ